MSVHSRSWIIGVGGMLAGSSLFAIDTAVEHLHLGPADLHFWIECMEFTLVGPGLGLICLLLAERLRALRVSAAVREMAERERRFLVLGRMAAAVAHEVRNPLHTLRLVVDELTVEQPTLRSHPLRVHIDDSLERIDRAVDLVYRLARPETEDDGAGDVVATVRDAQAALAMRVPDRAVIIGEMPARAAVRCSASGLRIMIDNLLRNAAEAIPADASITVDLRHEAGRWLLRIVNPGELAAVHDPSMPANAAGLGKPGGLGLGLAITRHLADGVGGTLSLRSHNGAVIAELALPAWKDTAP